MNNDSVFLYHAPCPKCGSKDNLGVWEDGHKWCFGCSYFVPPPDTIENLKKKIQPKMDNKYNVVDSIDTSNFTSYVPSKAIWWLKKYGITDDEIQFYGICWNPSTDSLVFPMKQDGVIKLTNERYFGSNIKHPKYLTYGQKTKLHTFIVSPHHNGHLVIVEDPVSYIKVGRLASSLPLLGATIPTSVHKWAVGKFKSVRVWLDIDKATRSFIEASKFSQYIPDTRSILTEYDPKEYSTEQIKFILASHFQKV